MWYAAAEAQNRIERKSHKQTDATIGADWDFEATCQAVVSDEVTWNVHLQSPSDG